MSNIDTVTQAEAMLVLYGVQMPIRAIEKYQNCLSAQIFTINQTKLMKRLFGGFDEAIDIHHSAMFKTEVDALNCQSMLRANDYWVDSVQAHKTDQFLVEFHHQVSKLDEHFIPRHVAWVVSLISDLDGKYCNWDIDIDPSTKTIIASPTKHDKPITGVPWHSFENISDDYPDGVADLFRPKDDFCYEADEQTGINYSLLESEDVAEIMKKLRGGEGRVPLDRLHHFEDHHIDEVREILSHRLYTGDQKEIYFSDVALSQFRMGRIDVATELAIHALTLEEDLVGMAEESDDDAEAEVPFAKKCVKQKMRRDLDAQLPKGKKSTTRKPKL